MNISRILLVIGLVLVLAGLLSMGYSISLTNSIEVQTDEDIDLIIGLFIGGVFMIFIGIGCISGSVEYKKSEEKSPDTVDVLRSPGGVTSTRDAPGGVTVSRSPASWRVAFCKKCGRQIEPGSVRCVFCRKRQ